MFDKFVSAVKAIWKFVTDSFCYQVVGSLLSLAFIEKSAPIAYAAVLGMGFIMAYDLIKAIKLQKSQTFDIPADVRRKIQDLEARITTIEFEKKARGF